MSIWMPLSPDEWRQARYTAMQRQYKPGSRNRHGAGSKTDEKQFADHIMGAAAECAVAKLLGLDWTGHYDQPKSTPDIEPNFEVRWRGYSNPEYQELYIRKDDYDDRYYILTCHGRGEKGFEIVGGIWGEDAKTRGRWDNPGWKGWAYWVPKDQVEPIENIFLVKYQGMMV